MTPTLGVITHTTPQRGALMICPSCESTYSDPSAMYCPTCSSPTNIEAGYRLVHRLGQGGSSTTYRALDPAGETVALKILRIDRLEDWKSLEMFERQFELLASLEHPRIPKVHRTFDATIDGVERKILVQDFIAGETLDAAISSGNARFDEDTARAFLLHMLDILGYLHSFSPPIIHRDIKPQNIIYSSTGEPILIDFDTARGHAVDPMSVTGTMVGTAGYVPLEQLSGNAVPASDIYSLGITLIAILSGVEVVSIPTKQLQLQFEPFINVSEDFARVIRAMVNPAVEARPRSVEQVKDLLATTTPTALPRAGGAASGRELGSRPLAAPPARTSHFSRSQAPVLQGRLPAPTTRAAAAPIGRAGISHSSGYTGEDIGVGERVPARTSSFDPNTDEPHHCWASQASASSNYGGSWDVSNLIGPPKVFPQHGDISGAWTSSETECGIQHATVRFDHNGYAATGLLILETYNPGAVFAVATRFDGIEHTLWQRAPGKTRSKAHVLEISFTLPTRIDSVTLWLDTSRVSGYNEIDAIALLLDLGDAPTTATSNTVTISPARGFSGSPYGHAYRLSQRQIDALSYRRNDALSWATSASTSSNYGGSWDISNLRGRPEVFPKHGDISGAWAQDSSDAGIQWARASFRADAPAIAVMIFETYNPGAIFCVVAKTDRGDEVVYYDRPADAGERAQLLCVELPEPMQVLEVELWLDTSIGDSYNELDAVALFSGAHLPWDADAPPPTPQRAPARAPAHRPEPTPRQHALQPAPEALPARTGPQRRTSLILGVMMFIITMLTGVAFFVLGF